VAGSLLLNYYFTPPLHEWTIAERNNALALVVFVAVAVMVSAVVDLAARRTSEAARASAEAETLSILAGDVLRGEAALPALLDRVRETFGLSSVALLERGPAADGAGGHQFGRLSARPAAGRRHAHATGRAGLAGRPTRLRVRPATYCESKVRELSSIASLRLASVAAVVALRGGRRDAGPGRPS
jgi:two-component system, OmpR family, sensor histidine kinase KdpD